MKTKSKPKKTNGRKSVKASAMELLRKLPPQSTWDDLMYRINMRQTVEERLREAEKGVWIPHEEVFRKYQK